MQLRQVRIGRNLNNISSLSFYSVILFYHFEYFFMGYGLIPKSYIIHIFIINPMPARNILEITYGYLIIDFNFFFYVAEYGISMKFKVTYIEIYCYFFILIFTPDINVKIFFPKQCQIIPAGNPYAVRQSESEFFRQCFGRKFNVPNISRSFRFIKIAC